MAASVVSIAPAVAAAFGRGDREAFLSVYDTCAPAMRGMVGRFFVRPFDREEAVQEIWLLAFRMASSFDPARGELWPWLRALGANRCKEILRARGRRPEGRLVTGVGGPPGEDERTAATSADPEQEVDLSRLRSAVNGFAATLLPEERLVFQLSLLEERSDAEVAAAAHISPRRCKYLRMKLLARAERDPGLAAAMNDLPESTAYVPGADTRGGGNDS